MPLFGSDRGYLLSLEVARADLRLVEFDWIVNELVDKVLSQPGPQEAGLDVLEDLHGNMVVKLSYRLPRPAQYIVNTVKVV